MGPLLVFLLSLEDRSEVGGLTPISLVLQALGQLKIYRGIVNSTGMLQKYGKTLFVEMTPEQRFTRCNCHKHKEEKPQS
jgi:hypothetical protein